MALFKVGPASPRIYCVTSTELSLFHKCTSIVVVSESCL